MAALLAKAQGAVADGDRLLLWTEAGDLYAFALTAEGLSLTAERQELGAVLTAQATAAGYALLLQEGNDVRYLALDAALNETASAAARGAGTVLSAQAYGDGGLLLTAESLHYLTAAGDKALSLTGDGFRRLAEDTQTIYSQTGAPAVQLHTGGMCHLDADMSRQGLREIGSEGLDLVFLENVGNLVCPAEFDTGAEIDVVILSVPEGDDKPLKYPLMFEEADVVLVTKTDAMPAFDFDENRFEENLRTCNHTAPFFFISAKGGGGMENWCQWLLKRIKE